MGSGSAIERISVGRCLSVTKVRTMSAPSNASSDSRFFNGLADHNAILLELLGQNSVQERIATTVQGQDENGEDLGLFKIDQVYSSSRSQSEKGDGRPTDKVRKDQQGHSFSDPTVIGIPSLGAANSAVHLEVASHQDAKGHTIDQHEENDEA